MLSHWSRRSRAGWTGVFGRVFEDAEQAGVLLAVGAELLVVGQAEQARAGGQNIRLVQHVADGQVGVGVGRGRHVAQHVKGDGVAQLGRKNFGHALIHGAKNVLRAVGRDKLGRSRLGGHSPCRWGAGRLFRWPNSGIFIVTGWSQEER